MSTVSLRKDSPVHLATYFTVSTRVRREDYLSLAVSVELNHLPHVFWTDRGQAFPALITMAL